MKNYLKPTFSKFLIATAALFMCISITTTAQDIKLTKQSNSKNVQNNYDPNTVDDELMSKNIRNYLKNDYLKKELGLLTENDRKFQMYMIDLNGDGKDEYFVRFMSSYFCGTGGCTFLLLDRYAELINVFTVMDAPLYITKKKTKGWNNIYLHNNGSFRVLMFNGQKYPSNPSIAKKAKYNPKDAIKVLFDDSKRPAKTYSF